VRAELALLAALSSALLGLGCSEPVSGPAPTKPADAGALAAKATDAGVAGDAATALPKLDIQEGEFAESDKSRDPFRSFADMFADEDKGKLRSQKKVLLDQYSVDELKLIGIVTRIHPAKAMLVDPSGKGHVVQRGQLIGRAEHVQPSGPGGAAYDVNWRVDRIRDGDIVLVREDPQNPQVPSATRVLPLRPEGTVVVSD
jgi:type IV pilus assembly protein PilP